MTAGRREGRGRRRAVAWRRRAAVGLLTACLAGAGAGCGDEPEPPTDPEVAPVPEATGPRDVAVIEVAGLGEIHVELLPEVAPQTVAQFEALAREGYYDGTTFHRVVPEFVIQGGDPNSRDRDPRNDGQGGRDREIALETSEVGFARGVVAMAHRGAPQTSGPQFFVTLEDRPDLDGQYALFGHVVDAIARVSRDVDGRYGPPDRPLEDVVIATIRIEEDAGGTAAAAQAADVEGAGPSDAEPAAEEADDADDLGGGEWREGAP